MIARIVSMIRVWFRPSEHVPDVASDREEIEQLEQRMCDVRSRAEMLGVRVDVTTRRHHYARER